MNDNKLDITFLAAFFCCFDSVQSKSIAARYDTGSYPINFIRWGLPAVTMIWQP